MARAGEAPPPLRIGFVGSGFIARFHARSFEAVRHAQISGVYSPTPANRDALVQAVNDAELGPCRAHASLESLLVADDVDAIWLLAPNDRRLEVMAAIHAAVTSGRSRVRAVACEKPLGRTLAEAREVLRLAQDAGLAHGYLENQVFSTAVERGKDIIWRRAVPASGRPYLARAAEEHSGPHEPWFWQGQRQGGGVMSDMMCHSVEVGRFLLTAPDAPRASLTVKSVQGSVAHLKWTQDRYARSLAKDFPGVQIQAHPVEDFARATITLEDETGQELIVEASTSWSYVGPGLRIDLALLGPEYAMEFSSLNPSLKIFLSRAITGSKGGEDLVEKQNAEQGQMPIVEDEAGTYGYVGENRHMVDCFRHGRTPIETFEDGVEVTRMVMALYKSAETGQVVRLPDKDLETYVPVPAREG